MTASRSSRIFTDKGKLSPRYIPERLPHREQQLKKLLSTYDEALTNVEASYLQITQVVGSVGTGKTCTAIKFGRLMEETAARNRVKLTHVYINGKIEGTSRYNLYRRILEKAAPAISSRSLSPEEMLFHLLRLLRDQREYLILSFDEIDYTCRHSKERIVYDLTRLNEMEPEHPCHVLGVIFIARDLSFHNLLDPTELSTLGRDVLEFPAYSSQQIRDILSDRVEMAFKPGSVSDEVLGFISDIAAGPPVNGDVRVALDLLLYSGNLAESRGFDKVLPDHVRKVYGETYPQITTEDVLNLDADEKLILLGLARALLGCNTSYVGLTEIREAYRIVCEEQNVKHLEDIEEQIQDLIDRGIVEMKSLKRLGISHVATRDLERFLNTILQRLRGTSNED